LLGAVVQLSAQAAVLARKWDLAESRLEAGKRFFAEVQGGIQSMLIDKWAAFMELLRRGSSDETHEKIEGIRRRALELSHWETLRECDRYEALARKDEPLAAHLYFGTPWPKYREKLAKHFDIPATYEWVHGKSASKSHRLDLVRGQWAGGKASTKVGQMVHRVLTALCSDFYRPLRLAPFHHLVYPKEFFNPSSSPNRMYRAMHSFKRWCEDEGIPLRISNEKHWYRLEATAPLVIVLDRAAVSDREGQQLELLAHRYRGKEFTRSEASKILGLSATSVRMLLNQAREEKRVEKVSSGPRSRYRFSR
jgi:hypothetical protein